MPHWVDRFPPETIKALAVYVHANSAGDAGAPSLPTTVTPAPATPAVAGATTATVTPATVTPASTAEAK